MLLQIIGGGLVLKNSYEIPKGKYPIMYVYPNTGGIGSVKDLIFSSIIQGFYTGTWDIEVGGAMCRYLIFLEDKYVWPNIWGNN